MLNKISESEPEYDCRPVIKVITIKYLFNINFKQNLSLFLAVVL